MNNVVTLEEKGSDIVLLTMKDEVSKNTFSPELLQGLQQAFSHINQHPTYKVVVMTGYDSYFCSGGTQEALLSLSEKEGNFTKGGIYSMPLDCRIPVVAAMQGHGIGGGFVFGLFSDYVILGRESVYTTNFMKYGFTPGFGGTCILREKLGLGLAQEMLMGADTYRGEDLKQRGITFPVYPRDQVLDKAMETARLLAEKPRVSLITLKDHLVEDIRQKLPSVVEKEVAMHNKTFHLPEVKERIKTVFGR
ncbi:polyketide synthase [Alteromonas sp. a30]|uniref:polyketide synthase n=1 Tax=Alteromonas sp. a30 TaxID=2730917 RepID=UPI00227FACBB|nr:polyketide synthase [Alteromonas sp. a30]MCY7295056.1 enoyl-CoA hydratase [Alteromonas sp. a30]